jgi:hypothetical protein
LVSFAMTCHSGIENMLGILLIGVQEVAGIETANGCANCCGVGGNLVLLFGGGKVMQNKRERGSLYSLKTPKSPYNHRSPRIMFIRDVQNLHA